MTQAHFSFGRDGFGSYQWTSRGPIPTNEEAVGILCPGFVDIHIHGAFGIDFMSASIEELERLSEQLSQIGYEAYLPTTVSASADAVKSALRQLPKCETVPGFHLEGPFVSPNYPGAQPKESIVSFDEVGDAWSEILNDPRLRIITLAPEQPGALDQIAQLAKRGVIVSMGHTDATYAQALAGAKSGVRHSTHTFNAMRGLHHREAGALGFALTSDEINCEVIYDRLHISREAMQILLTCKGPDHIIAVSDCTMAYGMPVGSRFEMWGTEVQVRQGSVVLEGTETLAGSCVTLKECFQNLAADFGPELAIKVCSLNPRRALGLAGEPNLYVEFDRNLDFVQVHRVERG